jgi:hypothetical protein
MAYARLGTVKGIALGQSEETKIERVVRWSPYILDDPKAALEFIDANRRLTISGFEVQVYEIELPTISMEIPQEKVQEIGT